MTGGVPIYDPWGCLVCKFFLIIYTQLSVYRVIRSPTKIMVGGYPVPSWFAWSFFGRFGGLVGFVFLFLCLSNTLLKKGTGNRSKSTKWKQGNPTNFVVIRFKSLILKGCSCFFGLFSVLFSCKSLILKDCSRCSRCSRQNLDTWVRGSSRPRAFFRKWISHLVVLYIDGNFRNCTKNKQQK